MTAGGMRFSCIRRIMRCKWVWTKGSCLLTYLLLSSVSIVSVRLCIAWFWSVG